MSNFRTVRSILKAARLQKGISLEEASQALRIHPRFLKALEGGEYAVFSSTVHLKGFLKNYSSFLGLNVEEIMAFFRREYSESEKNELGEVVRPLTPTIPVITPERIISGVIISLVAIFFFYLFWQYRAFTTPPALTVKDPPRDFKTGDVVITVMGKTDKDMILTINGQKINLAEDGSFSTPITLLDGTNVLNFASKNKFGKETTVARTVVLERSVTRLSEEREATVSAQPYGLVNLEIRIGPNAAWVEVGRLSTQEPLFQGLILSGARKSFSDPLGLKVRTGNSGSTTVTLNGQDLGKMGREGEVVEKEFRSLP